MTKIDVFSGFLGAGKTTLLKKLIADAYENEKLVLIENEFGTVGIDGIFMKETGIEISELNSGCICCSMSGDFVGQLKSIIEWESPDRILIEPSGVAKLSDIRRSVEQVQKACQEDDVCLNSLTTVIDATRCDSYMQNFGEFYFDQVKHAQCIILSRTDSLSEEKLIACSALLREYNPVAVLITTPWDKVGAAHLREIIEQTDSLKLDLDKLINEELTCCPICGTHCQHPSNHDHNCCGHDSAHSHIADDIFASWGVETPKCFSREELTRILEELEDASRFGEVIRAKGAVAGVENFWYYFDYLPGEFKLRAGEPAAIGRLCVIGASLNQERLRALFRV